LVVARRYGWHRDELYFLEAGRHLAWGYVDQPPFTPFIARLADIVAPGNLVVLRLLPAITTAGTAILGALIVRELGGRGGSQIAGAAVVAAGGFLLGVGHLLSTAVFDLTAWMALLWVVTRLLRTGDDRWWLAFGAMSGVALLNKNLLALLVTTLVVGLVLERRWQLLLSKWVVVGSMIAVVIALPNLIWEAQHGWPQLEMAHVLSRRLAGEDRATLLPGQLLFVGPAFIGLMWAGIRWLRRNPDFRPLLWMFPAGLVLAFLTGGRPYYVVPLTIVVTLCGVVAAQEGGPMRRLAWLIVPNALISLPLSLPVLPASSARVTSSVNEAVAETIGWPQLVGQVAGVVRTLPPAEQNHVVLLTFTYGEAGAIDRFGHDFHLPPAYSPHNSYADFRQPTDDSATVVSVRFAPDELAPYFDRCDRVGTVDNGKNIKNEVQGQPIIVCRGLRGHWSQVWPKMRFLG
jgi:4-amino-4-deoxy-L-arabinose transferase-like glycosyltransferase